MNRANAEIIDFTDWLKATETILLHFDVQDKQKPCNKWKQKYCKQQQQSNYYKELARIIEVFWGILIFRVNNTKSELLNFLIEKHHLTI
jgi:hypothetical protein